MNAKSYRGSVVKRPFGEGSKSERKAIYLVTNNGDYVLRRQGGNAFSDPQLEQMVGKNIECTGMVIGYTLLVSDCNVIDSN